MQPIRFGVQINNLAAPDLADRIHRYEEYGFSSINAIDHLIYPEWSPLTTLGVIAGLTESAAVGSPALSLLLHHPLELARAGAVLGAVAAGGCELGVGAGWLRDDWRTVGRELESVEDRVQRVEEAIRIIRSLWTQETTKFSGRFYSVDSAVPAMALPLLSVPKIVLGHEYVDLELAGRYADIVSLWPFTAQTIESADLQMRAWAAAGTIEYVGQIADIARRSAVAAGRDPEALEFQIEIPVQVVEDDTEILYRRLKDLRTSGTTPVSMTSSEMLETSIFLTGRPGDVRDRIRRQRDETGLNYLVLQRNETTEDWGDLERLVENVIEPLTGQ
ncbi:MAG: LLM class flavin-dependent oxidoreductase [Actinobacteria bacterium]|nr:LLM class flavin-dependent oxidoreductase [Actinomycetota bacterium]